MATAGGSRRKSHGGKATRRSLMLPHCCSTPMPRVATPARGSFLPRETTPDLFQADVRVQLWKSKSRRVSSLKSSRYRALDVSILLWRVWCRKLATNSEAIAEVHEHTVRVLGAVVSAERAWDPMSATKRFTTERMAATLFSRMPYGRCRREALSTNITTYRDPPREVG